MAPVQIILHLHTLECQLAFEQEHACFVNITYLTVFIFKAYYVSIRIVLYIYTLYGEL